MHHLLEFLLLVTKLIILVLGLFNSLSEL